MPSRYAHTTGGGIKQSNIRHTLDNQSIRYNLFKVWLRYTVFFIVFTANRNNIPPSNGKYKKFQRKNFLASNKLTRIIVSKFYLFLSPASSVNKFLPYHTKRTEIRFTAFNVTLWLITTYHPCRRQLLLSAVCIYILSYLVIRRWTK